MKGDFESIPLELSPNKSSRNGSSISSLIWHYTADIGNRDAIKWFLNEKAQASAHFVIDRNGLITQMVLISEKAWHAGKESIVKNASSIGVELVNPGYVEADGKGGWMLPANANGIRRKWEPDCEPIEKTLIWPCGLSVKRFWVPYADQQKLAAISLCALLAGSPWSACLSDQRGHEDIVPAGHKTDPGPLFPWAAVSSKEQRANHITKSI